MGRAKEILKKLKEANELYALWYKEKQNGKWKKSSLTMKDKNAISINGEKLKNQEGWDSIKVTLDGEDANKMSEGYSPREIQDILVVLNSSGGAGSDKYPFGNKELTAKVKEMESSGVISYDKYYSKWKKGK
jgi:hypothetical protein